MSKIYIKPGFVAAVIEKPKTDTFGNKVTKGNIILDDSTPVQDISDDQPLASLWLICTDIGDFPKNNVQGTDNPTTQNGVGLEIGDRILVRTERSTDPQGTSIRPIGGISIKDPANEDELTYIFPDYSILSWIKKRDEAGIIKGMKDRIARRKIMSKKNLDLMKSLNVNKKNLNKN